jgi:hypothetical protein
MSTFISLLGQSPCFYKTLFWHCAYIPGSARISSLLFHQRSFYHIHSECLIAISSGHGLCSFWQDFYSFIA